MHFQQQFTMGHCLVLGGQRSLQREVGTTLQVTRDLKHRLRRAQRTTTESKISSYRGTAHARLVVHVSSGRQNVRFAVLSEREYVFMYLRCV